MGACKGKFQNSIALSILLHFKFCFLFFCIFLQELFEVKEEDKEVVMDLCRERYRNRRYKLKVKYFDNEITQIRPTSILKEQWKCPISYWSLEESLLQNCDFPIVFSRRD